MIIRILITAGPTIEPIDPVRFISNRSTGYIGYKIAEVASKRKHRVTLISGPANLKVPKVKKFVSIETADGLLKVLKREIASTDCLIMCAAVSDFRVKKISKKKIKRQKKLSIELVPNKDLLCELSKYKGKRQFVGFSLETENLLRNSYRKLKNKNLDIMVANKLTKNRNPFGKNRLDAYIIDKSGSCMELRNKEKGFIAGLLLDKIERMWYLE